jgi:hypothetical protein
MAELLERHARLGLDEPFAQLVAIERKLRDKPWRIAEEYGLPIPTDRQQELVEWCKENDLPMKPYLFGREVTVTDQL